MLTPAEEIGLHGVKLAGLVRKAFHDIPEPELIRLVHALREEGTKRHLFYLRDGQFETVRVLPQPVTVLHEQLSYVRYVSLTILNALKRLPDLYLEDGGVRDVLPLSPLEEEWLRSCWGPSHRENNPVFGRLDAVVDFTSAMWKDSLHFVEPNLSGVGGLHLVPTAERLVADLVLPAVHQANPRLQLKIGQDIRDLLVQDIIDHLDAVGRPARNVCFIEPKYAGSGPDEQEAVAQYYHDRYGMKVMHADPAELICDGEEILYQGDRVDLGYRDYEVRDLIALEQSGVDVAPVRMLFRQNRMISSIAGDFDHKSCWEVLTDARFTQKHFSGEERQVFRRHILWTRVLRPRITQLPDGTPGDLMEYARREQETLVLKPNRSYGGDRILLGHTVSREAWQAAIDEAVADVDAWVVQQLAPIPVSEFPVIGPDSHIHREPFYLVMGFAPTRYGLSTLVRASQKQVVNVAQRGGICALMIGYLPVGLVEPV